MEIRFTKHAYQKMTERRISEEEVYEIFEGKVLMTKREEAVIIGKTRNMKYLTLVMDLDQNVLITLWPSSRKQRKLYQSKMGGKENG